ncbi:hypothetical protein AB0M43_24240 [Longispora sp. NPDC051575]|uniref:hypothetical protein n=1 Tax=Longispora sp. NPDC051575 TaxID=3154943 RepID=UPI00342521D5
MTDLRLFAGTGAALLGVALLLALPAPVAPTAPAGPAPAVELAVAWPGVATGTTTGTLVDGRTYEPALYLDPDTSLGWLSTWLNPAKRTTTYVLRTGDEVRELVPWTADKLRTVDAVAATATRVYWFQGTRDAVTGDKTQALHVADRAGGPPRQVTDDVGTPLLFGSAYDLQVVDGRLRWAADLPDGTEVRSVAEDGGEVTRTPVQGDLVLRAWPWATSPWTPQGTPVELVDLVGGARRTVPAQTGEQVSCGAEWCRFTTTGTLELRRPDGGDKRRIGGGDAQTLGFALGSTGRFELYSTPGAANATSVTSTIWLYDPVARRSVRIVDVASGVNARDGFLFWSTGDHETLMWHTLELAKLR